MSGNPFEIKVDTIVQGNEVLQRIQHAMKEIRQHDALVGIPQEENAVHPVKDGGGTISNAELLYIHSYGSPVNNIPPRDVLDSSIKHDQEQIADLLGDVLAKATEGNLDAALKALERAGVFAEGRAKAWFTDPANGWKGNEDITVEGGWMKNKKSGKPFYVKGKGSDRPLIDTGELRKSITSVVRRKGKAIG